MSFGGVLILANEDTNQLPAISGTEFSLTSTLLINFKCHFLTSSVRMGDPFGRRTLLDEVPQKPVPVDAIDYIISLCAGLG